MLRPSDVFGLACLVMCQTPDLPLASERANAVIGGVGGRSWRGRAGLSCRCACLTSRRYLSFSTFFLAVVIASITITEAASNFPMLLWRGSFLTAPNSYMFPMKFSHEDVTYLGQLSWFRDATSRQRKDLWFLLTSLHRMYPSISKVPFLRARAGDSRMPFYFLFSSQTIISCSVRSEATA